jgi:phosphatidylglycerophosphate synthase
LPNAITLFRVVLVPCVVLAAIACDAQVARGEDGFVARAWTVAFLVVIGASDVVDGFLARRCGLATQLGATLDALADKLAQVATITYFTLSGGPAFVALPLWFMVWLIARDVLLGGGWLVLRMGGGVHVEHRWHGKLASLLMFGLVFWVAAGGSRGVSDVLVVVLTVLTVLSTGGYVRDGVAQLPSRRA